MFRGVYTSASGMIANERKQQMLTNNLANALTPGFKQELAALRGFPEMLIHQQKEFPASLPIQEPIGTLHTGVYLQEGIPSFIQGDLQETGKNTDFALNDLALPVNPATQQSGRLFFAVQRGEEILYTRNGEFTVNPDGMLTTSDGDFVLDEALQPIAVETESNPVIPPLWIGYTENPEQLTRVGHGVFRWQGDANEQPQLLQNTALFIDNGLDLSMVIKQGHLERSNVDTTATMTEMITTFRLYEANQKVLQAYDRTLEKTANDIGRVY